MRLLNECSFINSAGIEKLEKAYNAKYIFESCLKGRDDTWLNFPAAIFYTEVAHPDGSNYFAMYGKDGHMFIANGISATEVEYSGIQVGNEVAYSRYRHDYRGLGECFIDGGRDYLRYGGDHTSTLVKFKVVKDSIEFIDNG
jgi:hypothetical protein